MPVLLSILSVTVQLNGQLLLGQPVQVKGSEHERNMAWELENAKTAVLSDLLSGMTYPFATVGSQGMMGLGTGQAVGVSPALPLQDLDDIDIEHHGSSGGLRLNPAARLPLMQGLAGSGGGGSFQGME